MSCRTPIRSFFERVATSPPFQSWEMPCWKLNLSGLSKFKSELDFTTNLTGFVYKLFSKAEMSNHISAFFIK